MLTILDIRYLNSSMVFDLGKIVPTFIITLNQSVMRPLSGDGKVIVSFSDKDVRQLYFLAASIYSVSKTY